MVSGYRKGAGMMDPSVRRRLVAGLQAPVRSLWHFVELRSAARRSLELLPLASRIGAGSAQHSNRQPGDGDDAGQEHRPEQQGAPVDRLRRCLEAGASTDRHRLPEACGGERIECRSCA